MAEQLAKDLWRLEIPLEGSPLKTLNSYLIRGERSLLIDTGFRRASCRAAMERQLEELEVDRERMDIFVTHLHSDHVGLAPELVRPGCRIFMGEIDGPGVEEYMAGGCWRELYARYELDGFTREETERLLADKTYLESVYKAGAERAGYAANKTLRKVYKKIGFVPAK